jgi:hypothetical protein
MDTKTLFNMSLNLIRNPSNWTQGFYARDIDGLELMAYEPNAICWCSQGALDVFAFKYADTPTRRDASVRMLIAINEAFEKHLGMPLTVLNDTRKHAEVIAEWEKVGKAERWL